MIQDPSYSTAITASGIDYAGDLVEVWDVSAGASKRMSAAELVKAAGFISGTQVERLSAGGLVIEPAGVASAVAATAALEVRSTTLGFLPPKMTSTQRDAITTPPEGLMIYNTTTSKLNVVGAAGWEAVTSV